MADELKRTYTIPIRKESQKATRQKRTNRAVKAVRAFLEKHMKSDNVKLGKELNLLLWKNGSRNPPGKITVDAVKDKEGKVMANLEGIAPVASEKKEAKPKTESKAAAKAPAKEEEKESTDVPAESKADEKAVETSAPKATPEVKAEEKAVAKEAENAAQDEKAEKVAELQKTTEKQ